MGNLMRSRLNRRIAGVCGGIAEQNGWDPTIVRLIWVALLLFAGTGVLVYIVLWIVLPEAPFALPPQAGYVPTPNPYGGAPGGYYPPQQGAGPSSYPGQQTYQGPPAPPPAA